LPFHWFSCSLLQLGNQAPGSYRPHHNTEHHVTKERSASKQRTADDDACRTRSEGECDGGDNREDPECAAVAVMVGHGSNFSSGRRVRLSRELQD
jgi:hypothetical protein